MFGVRESADKPVRYLCNQTPHLMFKGEVVMSFIIWLLKLFGWTSWAAALETKIAVDKQESEQRENEIAQEVEDEKQEVANIPDDSLDDLLDKLRDDAQARADSRANPDKS